MDASQGDPQQGMVLFPLSAGRTCGLLLTYRVCMAKVIRCYSLNDLLCETSSSRLEGERHSLASPED